MKRPASKLRIPKDVADLIRGLHPQLKRKLRAALQQILVNPHSGKPLKNELAGLWSFRIGKFRAIYRLRGKQLDLVAFGPRERIYEETYRLVADAKPSDR
jgi:mRNA interferase RelE/StbE